MNILGIDILTFLILAPLFGALLVASLPANKWIARWTALGIGIAIFGVTVFVFMDYNANVTDGGFYLEESYRWFTVLGASWHVGIDGISASMMLLTGLLTPLAILISWEVSDRPNMHLALLLLFESASMGVFLAMDLMVFFLFYELSLVPMYFLINQWGSPPQKGVKYTGRIYASTKFLLYSMGGTLGMLLATQLIGFTAGTYEIAAIANAAGEWLSISRADEAFLGLSVGTVKSRIARGRERLRDLLGDDFAV